MAGSSENQPDTTKQHFRIWRATPDSEAMVAISDQAAYLIGNSSTYVCVDETGIALNGNITMNCTSDQIRQGGFFVKMNDFVRMIPSSVVTPIPPQIPFPPLAFATGIMQDLPVFLAALA